MKREKKKERTYEYAGMSTRWVAARRSHLLVPIYRCRDKGLHGRVTREEAEEAARAEGCRAVFYVKGVRT